MKNKSPLCRLLFLCAIPAAVSAGDAKSPIPTASGGDWEFNISVGAAYRQAGTLGFRGGSRTAGLFIPSFVGGDSLAVPGIGGTGEIGDRAYNDGYVLLDLGTGIDGLTTNWGYQNSGQASSDEIAFHATGYQSIRSDSRTLGSTLSDEDDVRDMAPILGLDAKMKNAVRGFRPGVSATLSWMPVKMNHRWTDYSLSQRRDDYRLDYTDTYNLGGVGESLPAAPYFGSDSEPGFALENIPDSRELDAVLIGSELADISNRITTRFRADHLTLSFGPTLEREITKTWTIQAAAGISMHWLHWSARQSETVTVRDKAGATRVASWNDSASGNRIVPGMYLQLGSEWSPEGQPWTLRTFLRGDFGDSSTLRVGPSEYRYDVDGYTAAVMIGFPL